MTNDNIFEIAERYGTPMYVFDIKELRERTANIKKILGKNCELCYAMKANPFLIGFLSDMVDSYEVCSKGEYEICKRNKIQLNKIVFSGVNKEEREIKEISENFNGVITIESLRQLRLVEKYKWKKKPELMLRLTNGSQFGLDESDIEKIVSEKNPDYHITAIQYYSGTQKRKTEELKEEVHYLDGFCEKINLKYAANIRKIEYGPGLFVEYFNEAYDDYFEIKELSCILNEYSKKYNFTIELGRYLAATCGMYISKAVDIKRNKNMNYAILDGGIHHISYYGQMVGIKVPLVKQYSPEPNSKKNKREKWNLCGSLCTMKDVLIKGYQGCVNEGDLFVFLRCGAYSVTETGYLFLSRDMPAVAIMDLDGSVHLLREKIHTYELNM